MLISEFRQNSIANGDALKHVFDLMQVGENLGFENLMSAFEDFAQGVLFDPRRNVPEYGWWPLHSMDAWYEAEVQEFGLRSPNPPNGYYFWYGAVRGYSFVVDQGEQEDWLKFGQALAVAAAIQNVAKPKRIVGPQTFQSGTRPPPLQPWQNPNNPPLPPGEIANLRSLYDSLSFDELDEKFKSTDGGRLGPKPPQIR